MAVTSGTSSWMQGSQSYHKIQFDHTQVLSAKSKYCDRLIMEATEVELRPDNTNREVGLKIGKIWTPILRSSKQKLS
jgi:hypothetical protein